MENRERIEYTCHGGMKIVVVPLFHSGRFNGFLQMTGIRSSTESPAAMRQKCRDRRLLEKLEDSFLDTPYFREDETGHIRNLFLSLGRLICSQQFVDLSEDNPLAEVLRFMRNNCNRPISLADAAEVVGKSESRLSHLFVEVMGKSFKQVQTEIKLEAIDRFLGYNPEVSVKELAYEMGFQDALYFSKFFKKNKGISVTEYRKRLKES